jgi:hypothetical protein
MSLYNNFIKQFFILIVGVFIINSENAFSQKQKFRAPEFNIRHGFIFPHHKSIQYLAKGFVNSYEAEIGFCSDTSKIWQKVHRFPTAGLGLMLTDYNNPEVLGKAFAAFFYIRHPIFQRNRFSVNYKFAEGISYLNKPFDPKNNVNNIVIGSRFNVHVFLGIEIQRQIRNRMNLLLGIGFTHNSNGAVKIPNKGINLVGISAGFVFDKKTEIPVKKYSPKMKHHILNYSFILTSGVHQLDDWGKKEYFIGTFSAELKKQKSYRFAKGFALDLFYDQAIKFRTLNDSITFSKKRDFFYPGIHVSGDYIFGKLSFTFQFGAYLFRRPYDYQYVYSRFGFRYKISKHVLANITLKTYFSAADFIEFGFGYYFETF